MAYLEQVLLTATLLLSVLLADTKSDDHAGKYKQHLYSDGKEFMWDPTADSDYLVKVGDMTFIKPEVAEKLEQSKRSKRLTYKGVTKWDNGVIPYAFSSYFTAHEIDEIVRAMSHYEENTCLRFKQRMSERDYIEFYKGVGCQSYIGKTGNKQGLSLLSGCINNFGTILHEIGHAIGLLHEHTRPDRDDYIDVVYENIPNGVEREFAIQDLASVDTLGAGYDYNSVMHYEPNEFGINSTTTIVADDPRIPVGGATALSELDIIKIGNLYQCPEIPPPRSTIYVPAPPPPVPKLQFSCGEFFDDITTGKVSSPGFPTYQTNQDCQWQLRARKGFQIRLDIVTLALHESPACSENYIELYDRLDCTGYMQARICARSNSFPVYYTFENTGCIRYHSGSPSNSITLKGFEITFTAEDIDECFFSFLCDHQCTNLPGDYVCSCPKGYFLAADDRSCFDVNECALETGHICEYKCTNFGGYHECTCPDGSLQKGNSCATTSTQILTPLPTLTTTGVPAILITTETGTIKTPNWPETYPINTDSEWLISCPREDQHIELGFATPFGLGGQMPNCPKDWVRVRHGHNGELLKQHCHLNLPSAANYSVNNLTVEFHAGPQHGYTRRGFKISYKCLNAAVAGNTMPTAQPTAALPTSSKTTHMPTTQPTTPMPTTTTTQPATTQPATTTEPATLCPPVTVPGLRPCGFLLTEDSGDFTSPNWPATYNVNEMCEWIIVLPNCTKGIEITFNGFSVASRLPDCPKDQVYIREGLAGGGRVHGPLCSLAIPAPVKLNSHIANVTMNAGPLHGKHRFGFSATYRSVDL